ncbi:hypothetical protein IAE35_05390 [Pseudomonas sp. S75]|uniref:hypothetical protein n=1 Tax=unclassified Pseudomonas TaxID=196821 RepID=UPI00190672CC|nr:MULTISPECIES: hypothetical protein [unclassified Pseudomonas]MBJ9975261.1 hypothetical protein [Pseudomonas sp. S30]MBK0152765.1 hypothetical protein [Pseudomonas sp. S75]
MQPVITCDFLLAPAYCDPTLIDEFVTDLMQIHADVTNSGHPPLLEDEAYLKLQLANRFPTDKVFSKNIQEDGVSIYSANDITTIVNQILSTAKSMEERDYFWVSDWNDLTLAPEIPEHDIPNRPSELSELFVNLALYSLTQGKSPCALHHYPPFTPLTEVNGTLLNAHPSQLSFPIQVKQPIPVHATYKSYFSHINGSHFFSADMSKYDLKLGIYSYALRIAREAGDDLRTVEWSSFSIGDDFMESMRDNQSHFEQRYFTTLIDCMSHIVADRPKNQLSPFFTHAGSGIQIQRNENLAFRSHITKSGAALRLMHWQTPSGKIIFANVGVKSELKIL